MAPALYSLLVPLVLVDVWITAYQFICLPLCGMPAVRRRDYFTLDRHRLAYLNALQKVNCTYCTYANGLFAYAREVAARTEAYWCPIRHGQPIPHAHTYYAGFSAFGDAAAFRRRRSRGLLLARPRRRSSR